jgi:hypothetical protein
MQKIAQRLVHGEDAAGERAVGKTDRVPLFEDAVLAEAILAGRHAGRRHGIRDAVQARDHAQRRARRPLVDVHQIENELGPLAMGERGADRSRTAMMQAAHRIEQMGEARCAGGERCARFGIAADGMADLRPHAGCLEVPQQGAVRVDLGRHGRDPDRRERGELVDQREIGDNSERRLGTERLRADERAFEMRPEHPGHGWVGDRDCRADAAERGQQIITRRGDRGREQRRGAMHGVEAGHLSDRIGARHDIGAGAAVDVQVDEARQHEPVRGRVRRRFDRPNNGGAAQPALHEALRRQDLACDRRGHDRTIIASRAGIR